MFDTFGLRFVYGDILRDKEILRMIARLFLAVLFTTGIVSAADNTATVERAADRLDQFTAKLPTRMRLELRFAGVEALRERHPELARKHAQSGVKELHGEKNLSMYLGPLRVLAALDPAAAAELAGRLQPGAAQGVIMVLTEAQHVDLAAKVFREVVASFDFEKARPGELWQMLHCAFAASAAAPGPAAETLERIAKLASGMGDNAGPMRATFNLASGTVTTDNARDTLLVVAGTRLRALDARRFEALQPLFANWDLSGKLAIKQLSFGPVGASDKSALSEPALIQQRMGQLRGELSDAERGKLAIEITRQIHAVDAGNRLGLALSLRSLATEGDLGAEAIGAVATTLADALRNSPANASEWISFAELLHYEHIPPPYSDPALEAALALLDLRDAISQEATFALTGLDGKTYSLESLHGRVVLLNFWATWCPPCRREMPDMQKLHDRFGEKLVVLAVSDEELSVVSKFLDKQKYTFPVALDTGRKVNGAFGIQGIPKSFVFDKEGKLVGQAEDARSERQFLEMLKAAGLE
jgi:peroxiredoxin